MASITISPNMNLPIPVVGQELGPQWATDLDNSLTLIDSHNHTPGFGVQIPAGGLNINADLPFNGNNATSLRTVRFSPQASAIPASGSDLGCLYEAGIDLYYNDGAGNQIRITQNGTVSGSSGTITGLPSGTASAAYQSTSGTFVFQQATSTGANIDVASVAIRYPGSYPTLSGNYIQLQAPSSLSMGYAITMPGAPPAASNAFIVMNTSGVESYVNIDGTTLKIVSGVLSTVEPLYVAPTIQVLSGSGTYTPTSAAVLYLKVTLVGGGGGGAGGGTGTPNGGAGGNTTFGSSLLTANGGAPAGTSTGGGGAGGSSSVAGGAISLAAMSGGSGGGGSLNSGGSGGVFITAASGGPSAFGGSGAGANPGGAGGAGAPTTGGGGGGGSHNGATGNYSGGGGGAGGYVEAVINGTTLATIVSSGAVYSVGTGGGGGAAGVTGFGGGAGGSGTLIVEEFYQ